jgi:hypothetical protein
MREGITPHLEPVNNVDVALSIELDLITRADPSAKVHNISYQWR